MLSHRFPLTVHSSLPYITVAVCPSIISLCSVTKALKRNTNQYTKREARRTLYPALKVTQLISLQCFMCPPRRKRLRSPGYLLGLTGWSVQILRIDVTFWQIKPKLFPKKWPPAWFCSVLETQKAQKAQALLSLFSHLTQSPMASPAVVCPSSPSPVLTYCTATNRTSNELVQNLAALEAPNYL